MENQDLINENGVVLLKNFGELSLSDFEGYQNNKVLQYIFE